VGTVRGGGPQVIELPGTRLPIYSWAAELEQGALAQAANCANLAPAFHHVAVMADGHQGYGVPIGAVLALDGAVSPYAVGNDIGCGMALVPTRLSAEDLLSRLPTRSGAPGPVARDELMGWVQHAVPAGTERRQRDQAPDRPDARAARAGTEVDALVQRAYDAMEEASAASRVALSASQGATADPGRPLARGDFAARGHDQLGTLGSGNHFVELLRDPEGEVWVLVHSGSRGVGGAVCANFHRMALAHCAQAGVELPDPGLAWLPVRGPGGPGPERGGGGIEDRWQRVGRCYAEAMTAALEYAEANRRRILDAVASVFDRRFPDALCREGVIDIHHNDAVFEEHFGRRVWVHRKGAVKAAAGTPTITPGSMGTGTVLGRGLGSADAFCSAAHGAGRALSRSRARKQLSLEEQLALVRAAGGKVFAARTAGVLDEMPGAYKDLDEVMARQADLVEPVRRFTPLATYKGVERGGGGKRQSAFPSEER
jgi:tRNA-splicing ligase RtcB